MHLLRGPATTGPRASAARAPAARRRPPAHHHRLRCRAEQQQHAAPRASSPPALADRQELPPPQSSSLSAAAPSLTKRMFDAVDARRAAAAGGKRQGGGAVAGGAGGRTTYDALLAADDAWSRMRGAAAASASSSASSSSSSSSPPPKGASAGPAPQFVRRAEPYEPLLRLGRAPPPAQQFDVCVCGGTLGVFLGASLARRGWRVAVLERGDLKGREQEWNLSRAELRALARAGAFASEADAEAAVVSEFNPVRVGFFDSWSSEASSARGEASSSSSPSSSSPSSSSKDVWARDVLNLGVSPDALVQAARRALEARGGRVFERAGADALVVHPDAVALRVSSALPPPSSAAGAAPGAPSSSSSSSPTAPQQQPQIVLSARLVLDVMGHGSPAARQLRHSLKPDGVCLVVGGCASGFDPRLNATADVIATAADLQEVGGVPTQLFWEAFPAAAAAPAAAAPAGGGPSKRDAPPSSSSPPSSSPSSSSSSSSSSLRTTYMFAYMDAEAWRPSLAAMFDAYWRYMPQYQRALIPPAAAAPDASPDSDANPDPLASLEFQRLLFGVFPTYRDSPLAPGFDRVLQVGDASGLQSPLSFGGLAALARHLGRLSQGLDDALACGQLDREGLAPLAPYTPNLSAAWMLQRAMTATRAKQGGGNTSSAPPELINRMLGGNFQAMDKLGERVSRPFLQDVLRPGGLALTLAAQMTADPLFVPPLLLHLGPGPLADFSRHFAAMALYDACYRVLGPALRFLAGEGTCRGSGEGGGGGDNHGAGGWLRRAGEPSLGVPPAVGYRMRRLLDAWKYGSGMDYEFD